MLKLSSAFWVMPWDGFIEQRAQGIKWQQQQQQSSGLKNLKGDSACTQFLNMSELTVSGCLRGLWVG